jgi:hypothetical protein
MVRLFPLVVVVVVVMPFTDMARVLGMVKTRGTTETNMLRALYFGCFLDIP